jgi:hypothetical protein
MPGDWVLDKPVFTEVQVIPSSVERNTPAPPSIPAKIRESFAKSAMTDPTSPPTMEGSVSDSIQLSPWSLER